MSYFKTVLNISLIYQILSSKLVGHLLLLCWQAVPCDKESCATILLEHSADPNLVDLDGTTALHYAACCQSVSLAAKLLKHKANLKAQHKVGFY